MISNTNRKSVSCHDVSESCFTQNNNEHYQQHWRQWEKSAPQGSGEFRDTAVARMIECLENKSACLDLSHLQLKTLPDALPPHITSLTLTGNFFTHVPEKLLPLLTQNTSPETSPLLNNQEPWQVSGKTYRLAIEDELEKRDQATSWSQPSVAAKAGAILAGAGLLAGFGSWFFYHRTAQGTPAASNDNDIADSKDFSLPFAQPLLLTSTLQPPISDKRAIEQGVVKFLRKEKTITGKKLDKEAIIAAAADWLFPKNSPGEPPERVISFARQILLAAGRYGGQQKEKLSLQQAKAVNRQWFFTTLLGSSLREYVARKISEQKNPQDCKLGDVSNWLSTPELNSSLLLRTARIPSSRWTSFTTMLKTFIHAEIPVLNKHKFIGAREQLFSSYDFLSLCTGVDYLTSLGIADNFTFKEMTTTGATIWGKMISNDTSPELLPYLVTPSLWYIAQTTPDLVKNTPKKYVKDAVSTVMEIWKSAQQRANQLEDNISNYRAALNAWDSKGNLAEKFIAICPQQKLLYILPSGESGLSEEQKNQKIRENAKERYLLGTEPPCRHPSVPEKLTSEYERVTQNIADAWKNLDSILIDNALINAAKDVYDFIFSSETVLRPAFLHMRTHRTPASGLGGMARADDIFISLENTDLISAQNKNDKRIYGLRRGKKGEYTLIRLDRNVDTYIKNGLLSNPQFWRQYTITENKTTGISKVLAAGYEFTFEVNTDLGTRLWLTPDRGNRYLVEFYSSQHRNYFYNALYDKGNTYSQTEQIWNSAKHIIPFYDCIEGLAGGKVMQVAEALPSCMLDALSLIPVVGQISALGGKFGLSLIQSIRSGVFKASKGALMKNMAKTAIHNTVLPSHEEVQSVLKNTLRALDPGLEWIYRTNSPAGRLTEAISDTLLAEKIKRYTPTQPSEPPAGLRKARLPNNGPLVSVKKTDGNRWVMANPQTGEASGRYYTLKNKQLTELDLRPHRLGTAPVDDGSVAKPPEQGTGLMQVPAGYNQIPLVTDRGNYWYDARSLTNRIINLKTSQKTNTELQKLEKFLDEPPVIMAPPAQVDEVIISTISTWYAGHHWRAWKGATQKVSGIIPEWLINMQANVHAHLEGSISYLEKTATLIRNNINSSNLLKTSSGEYLSALLATTNHAVISEALKCLLSTVERSEKFIKASRKMGYENVIIVSSDPIPDPEHPGEYISTIEPAQLKEIPIATVIQRDPYARIMIYADRYQCKDFSGIEGVAPPNTNTKGFLTTDILHETSHLVSFSEDNILAFYPQAGTLHSGEEIKHVFDANFEGNIKEIPIAFTHTNLMIMFDRIKYQQGITNTLDINSIKDAIKNDDMLRANIMLTDAHILSTIIRDFANGIPFRATIRAKRETANTQQNNNMTTRGFYNESIVDWLAIINAQSLRELVALT